MNVKPLIFLSSEVSQYCIKNKFRNICFRFWLIIEKNHFLKINVCLVFNDNIYININTKQ